MTSPTHQDSFDKSLDEPKLEGGTALGTTLTYGHDSLAEGEGPSTVADDLRTKAILRKIDLRLLPICSILYLFSFLDRTAIGNAKVAGMAKALKLNDTEYALALSLFFITYAAFEVPSNLMLKKFGAKIWIPVIVLLWGVVMLATGFVKSAGSLIALRVLLGLFEAGLFPGITALLSFLIPRAFLQIRIAVFFSAATIAGAFGGLLAYGLSHVKSGGLEGWSFIFIVEGALTILVAAMGYFMLFPNLDDVKFLTAEEKVYMSDRLRFDGQNIPMNDAYKHKYVVAGFTDWKTWLSLVSYIGSLAPLYCIALTLPTILKTSLGYDPVKAQIMTVPVYVVAAVLVLIFAYFSDRLQCRTLFLILGCAISAIGWGVGLASHNPHTRYAACFIAAAGSYAGFPSVVALLSQNVGGKTKRATCIALQVGIGGLSGIISSNIFPSAEAPHFYKAYKICIGLNCAAIIGAVVNVGLLYLANKSKQAKIDSGEAEKMSREQVADMGDASPYFKFKY